MTSNPAIQAEEERQAKIAALKLAIDCIMDAAREGAASPLGGAPSGVVYAALMAHGMSLNAYQSILGILEKRGKIRIQNHLIIPA